MRVRKRKEKQSAKYRRRDDTRWYRSIYARSKANGTARLI